MEFERSLFRVYEKVVSSINLSTSLSGYFRRPSLFYVMAFLLSIGGASFLLLIVLHLNFAGDGSCLENALSANGLDNKIIDVTTFKNITIGPETITSDSIIRLWAFPLDDKIRDVSEDPMMLLSREGIAEDGISLEGPFKPDYEFAADPAFLLIDESLRSVHLVRQINITFDTSSCYGVWGKYPLLQLILGYSLDEVIVNQFIHGLRESEGVLRSQSTHESWSWSAERNSKRDASAFARINQNFAVLWRVCILFFLVSSVTALMVRTLISSGVAAMFPIVSFLKSLGLVDPEVFRLLAFSYPWIGADMNVLVGTGRNIAPLVRSHITNVLVTYASYEACQFAWRRWLLGFKPQPAGLEVFIFAYVMVCEYFLLIFARSKTTLRYLPKVMSFSLILFLQYAFGVPYGFISWASIVLWAWTLFWMVWFVYSCETKALRRGIVSLEAPRAFYTLLPSPQWPLALPPHWSIYHDMNMANRSIYDENDLDMNNEANINDVERGLPSSNQVRTSSGTTGSASSPAVPPEGLAHRRGRRSENAPPTAFFPIVHNPSIPIHSSSPPDESESEDSE